jgi:hypothetical protein
MSNRKWIVAFGLIFSGLAHSQTVEELAEAQRAKQVAEMAFVKNANDAISLSNKLSSEKSKGPAGEQKAVVRAEQPRFQLHSVINRNDNWFGEVARSYVLSRAVPGAVFGSGTVTSVSAQGMLVSFPDTKCLSKKSKMKGKKAAANECSSITKFVAVGDRF